MIGWSLGGLVGLWLAGRGAIAISEALPPGIVALIDLLFPLVLGASISYEIVAGKNWRNLIVVGMLAVFIVGNAVFHWEAARGDYAAGGYGLRIGLGAGIMMIALIGGRIVPSFTRNWLEKRDGGRLPVPPMQLFDKLALLVLLAALLLWVSLPEYRLSGVALVLAGSLHLMRLARWVGYRTFAEPLVAVLHAAYAFLPLGALGLGVEILAPGLLGMAAVQHLWMGGAIGLMTLAVMTRATLGHTGQALAAGAGTIVIYLALVLAVLARVAMGVWPGQAPLLLTVSGLSWLGAFAGFTVFYGRLLLQLPAAKRA
jgi:uncharacterized protein involved in response to NO